VISEENRSRGNGRIAGVYSNARTGGLRQANTPDTGYTVESGVEGRDSFDTVVQHHGGMHGVSAGYPSVRTQQIAGTVCVCQGDAQHNRAYADKQIVYVAGKV
jgi:hypothetical protein